MRETRHKGAISSISRLFEYGELVNLAFKLSLGVAFSLYVLVLTGLLPSFSDTLLRTVSLRIICVVTILLAGLYATRRLRVSVSEAKRRKKLVKMEDPVPVLVSILVLIAIALFYLALLLY